MHTARLRRVLIALSAATLLLTGCSDEPSDPAAMPPKTPTPSVSASPSSGAEPELEVKPETAKEFIARWVALQNQMMLTGKTREYVALSPGCNSCTGIAERVRSTYQNGGYVKTDGWTVQRIRQHKVLRSKRFAEFDVWVISAATEYRESTNGAIQNLPGGRVKHHIVLATGVEWSVAELSAYPS